MKEQIAFTPKRDQLSLRPKSITKLGEGIDPVMKQISERAFQLFEERGHENGHDQEDWFKAEAELLTPVSIKITDAHLELCIRAHVPGFEPGDVGFNLGKNLLTIQGSKQTQTAKEADKTQCSWSECKMIFRKVPLPFEVIPEKAEATVKNGVLEIVAPKAVSEPVEMPSFLRCSAAALIMHLF